MLSAISGAGRSLSGGEFRVEQLYKLQLKPLLPIVRCRFNQLSARARPCALPDLSLL